MSAVGQPYDATSTVFILDFSVGAGWLTTATASSFLSVCGKRFLPARTAFEVVFKVSRSIRGERDCMRASRSLFPRALGARR